MTIIKAIHKADEKLDIDLSDYTIEIGEGAQRLLLGANTDGRIFLQAAGGGLHLDHSAPSEMMISVKDGRIEGSSH